MKSGVFTTDMLLFSVTCCWYCCNCLLSAEISLTLLSSSSAYDNQNEYYEKQEQFYFITETRTHIALIKEKVADYKTTVANLSDLWSCSADFA